MSRSQPAPGLLPHFLPIRPSCTVVSTADRDGLEGGLAMRASKWEVFCQVLPVLGPHEKEDPKWSLSQNGSHSLYMFARSGPSDSLTEDPFPRLGAHVGHGQHHTHVHPTPLQVHTQTEEHG